MRTFTFAIALMLGGTALAQTAGTAGSGDMSGQSSAGSANAQSASGPGTAGYSSQSSTTDMNGQPQVGTDSSNGQSGSNMGSGMNGQTQTGWNNAAGQTQAGMNGNGQSNMATNAMAGSGSVVQPSNARPRRDARGIRVISLAAAVPAGWNGIAGGNTGTGGPLLDPNTGQATGDTGSYRPCSRGVTDKCVQTYEVGRRHRR